MKINLVSDAHSWKNAYIEGLEREWRGQGHTVHWAHRSEDIEPGELAFILGFFQIIPDAYLGRNAHNLVVHESRLPKGRGWSPMTWQVIEGAKAIDLTLFEAVAKVDAGKIYLHGRVPLEGHELLPEVREKTIAGILQLCRDFVADYPAILAKGQVQKGRPTYYPLRRAEDSRLDPRKSLAAQFNLLRTVDNEHYPAYFDWKGHRYRLKIEKSKGGPDRP